MPVDGDSLIRRLAVLLIYQCMSVPTSGTTVLHQHHFPASHHVLTRCNRNIVVVSMKVWVDHNGSQSAASHFSLARKLQPLFREVVASAPYLHESNLNLVVADSPPLTFKPNAK